MRPVETFTDLSVLTGMISLIDSEFANEQTPSERQGIVHGRHIIALFIIEILLKKTLDHESAEYEEKHNIKTLFDKLPPGLRKKIGKNYIILMNDQLEYTLDFCKSAGRLVNHLAKCDITHARYIWNIDKKQKHGEFLVLLDDLVNLIYAIMIVSFGYDYEQNHGPIQKNYDTKFLSPQDVRSNNVQEGVKLHNTCITRTFQNSA